MEDATKVTKCRKDRGGVAGCRRVLWRDFWKNDWRIEVKDERGPSVLVNLWGFEGLGLLPH
jgi:hypothetical protein